MKQLCLNLILILAISFSLPTVVSASQQKVRSYIIERANYFGVPSSIALWIAEKESMFDPSRRGDKKPDGSYCSYGLWQINLCVHKDITKAQALNLKVSTEWAMEQFAKGNYEIWSSYRFATRWYKDYLGIFD